MIKNFSNFILNLKHWQLFMLTWGIPILFNFLFFNLRFNFGILYPLSMICFAIGTFGWIWAISVQLNPLVIDAPKLNLKRFKIRFFIPIGYIMLILVFMITLFLFESAFDFEGTEPNKPIFFVGIILFVTIHFTSLILIFWTVGFAAKTLRSVELGRNAERSEYIGDFMLIWLNFIGIWFIQPRINKILEEKNEANKW